MDQTVLFVLLVGVVLLQVAVRQVFRFRQQQAVEQLSDQYRVLANQFLEEKNPRSAEQKKISIGALLEPLCERISDSNVVLTACARYTSSSDEADRRIAGLMWTNRKERCPADHEDQIARINFIYVY